MGILCVAGEDLLVFMQAGMPVLPLLFVKNRNKIPFRIILFFAIASRCLRKNSLSVKKLLASTRRGYV